MGTRTGQALTNSGGKDKSEEMFPKSFMSEHTAEYVLVNDLVRRLAPAFPEAIPIFFWSTREGNLTAVESMSTLTFRVVTCFARRPKIESLDADSILMKVNRELLDYCRASADVGIPVLAGLPIVKSLHLLRLTSPCNWFDLATFNGLDGEFYVEINLNGKIAARPRSIRVRALNDREMKKVIEGSKILTWDCAVEGFRAIRRTMSSHSGMPGAFSFPFFFGGYKPFHIVLPIGSR